jgi:hypothetical protein
MLDKQDRKIFDEMWSYSRLYNAAGTMACRPVLIQPILISYISTLQTIGHYTKVGRKTKLNLYIACAILITIKFKNESRRKFINLQCMRKAKDNSQATR